MFIIFIIENLKKKKIIGNPSQHKYNNIVRDKFFCRRD